MRKIKHSIIKGGLLCLVLLVHHHLSSAQGSQDTIAVFDSLTIEDDQDLDTSVFVLTDRWGQEVAVGDHVSDSFGMYWRYQPAYWDGGVHTHLGNTGSATLATYWRPDDEVGFRHGFEPFDLFRLRAEDHVHFITDRSYTDISYNQAPQQTKSQTNILFGRSISNSSGISLRYDRINDDGEYFHQKFRHTGVSVGAYHYFKPNRSVHFTFSSNNILSEDNGGVQDRTVLNDPNFDDRLSVPTVLSEALTEMRDRTGLLTMKWAIDQGTTRPYLYILADAKYMRTNFLFSDAGVPSDSDFYGIYDVDRRGRRAHMDLEQWSGSGGVAFDFGTDARHGELNSRIRLVNNDYTQGTDQETILDVIWQNAYRQSFDKWTLDAEFALHLGDLAGDYLGCVRGSYALFPAWTLYAEYRDQRQTPTGVDRRFVTLERVVYNRDKQASQYRTFRAGIDARPWKAKLEVASHILTDHLYFTEGLVPDQIDADVILLQAHAAWNYQVGVLYMDHHVYLQQSDDDRLPRPTLTSSHYLGIRWRAFKRRLHLDTGFDARVLPDEGWGYFPMMGRFFPLTGDIDSDYTVDGVFAFQVDRFRVFFKWENMHLTWSDAPRFMVENYPLFDGRLRLGFRWLLRG